MTGVLVAGLILAPAASAMSWGLGAAGTAEAASAGAKPAYGLVWATKSTMQYGAASVNRDASSMKAQGVVPVLQWYYWGNSISPNCVRYGCNGLSTGQWNAYATSLARGLRATLGSYPAIVIIETEFNKNGVQSWPGFDGYLKSQESIFRANAPNVKLVIGFGSWGTTSQYRQFSGSTWAADYAGFQNLKSAYRSSASGILNAFGESKYTAEQLHAAFPGKALILDDLAISTWPDAYHAQLQRDALVKFFDGQWTLANLGVKIIVYRWVRDVPTQNQNDYHGPAEPYWGLKWASGGAKPAWGLWLSRAH